MFVITTYWILFNNFYPAICFGKRFDLSILKMLVKKCFFRPQNSTFVLN